MFQSMSHIQTVTEVFCGSVRAVTTGVAAEEPDQTLVSFAVCLQLIPLCGGYYLIKEIIIDAPQAFYFLAVTAPAK